MAQFQGRIVASTQSRGAVCSREDSRQYDVLSYTSEAAGGSGVMKIPSSIPGQLDVRFIPGQITILFIPGQIKILFIPRGWCSFTHTSVRGPTSA